MCGVCADCQWWVRIEPAKVTNSGESALGNCFLNPPSIGHPDFPVAWARPETEEIDFCSHYETQEKEEVHP
jgi:hypothetical protein